MGKIHPEDLLYRDNILPKKKAAKVFLWIKYILKASYNQKFYHEKRTTYFRSSVWGRPARALEVMYIENTFCGSFIQNISFVGLLYWVVQGSSWRSYMQRNPSEMPKSKKGFERSAKQTRPYTESLYSYLRVIFCMEDLVWDFYINKTFYGRS